MIRNLCFSLRILLRETKLVAVRHLETVPFALTWALGTFLEHWVNVLRDAGQPEAVEVWKSWPKHRLDS